MNPFAISVVMPTYNRQEVLPQAIESILRQTNPPAEIIIVDDGSTDDTPDVVHAFGNKLIYIHQAKAGATQARHQGFIRASHPWVAQLDSDDIWDPDHLSRMEKAIQETGGNAHFYFANTILANGRSLWTVLNFEFSGDYRFAADGSDWVLSEPRQPMMHQSAVINREAYLDSGGYLPAAIGRNDLHIFLKLGLAKPICAVAGTGAIMSPQRGQSGRVTAKHKGDFWARMKVIVYADILASRPDVKPRTKAILRARLSTAYKQWAGNNWQVGNYALAIKELSRGFGTSPRNFMGILYRKLNQQMDL